MKIAIAGGQTGGPIVPLLAVVDEIKKEKPHTQVLLLDVPKSAAHRIANKEKLHFKTIHTGKLRRYWSLRTALSPIAVGVGFLESLVALRKFKPDIVLGAGGFVEVPVVWAAAILKIPVLLHQQDVRPSLSNVLAAPLAKRITVSFEQSVRDFPEGTGFFRFKRKKKDAKVIWTGNPFRASLKDSTRAEAQKYFKLNPKLPVLLVLGGGSGAAGLNKIIHDSLPQLTEVVQIIHSTGPGKLKRVDSPNYHPKEFIERMDLAYAAADLVVSRAGISTVTELANLGKVSIIIPMPKTHQVDNALLLYDAGAAIPMDQTTATPHELVKLIRKLLLDGETQKFVVDNIKQLMPKNSAAKIAALAIQLAENGK